MKVEVRFLGMDPSPAVKEYAARRVAIALGRRAAEIDEVLVRMGDVNGPKGGFDKRCQVMLRGRQVQVTVDALAPEATTAIDLAVAKADRGLSAELGRARTNRRARGRWFQLLLDDAG